MAYNSNTMLNSSLHLLFVWSYLFLISMGITVVCHHPMSCCIYTVLVSLIFGTSIPTSFNILMKYFLHFHVWFTSLAHAPSHSSSYVVSVYILYLLYIVPDQPSVSVASTTSTSISLSWTTAGSVVTSYEVMWQRDTSVGCSDEDEGSTTITDGSTSYEIMGLEEDSSYSLTVTAANAAGSSEVSETVTAMIEEAGER